MEVRDRPPLTQSQALRADYHTLVKEQDNCRIYKLSLRPGGRVTVSYAFFHVRVVLRGGDAIQNTLSDSVQWKERLAMGDAEWKEPCANLTVQNLGDAVYEAYICELI